MNSLVLSGHPGRIDTSGKRAYSIYADESPSAARPEMSSSRSVNSRTSPSFSVPGSRATVPHAASTGEANEAYLATILATSDRPYPLRMARSAGSSPVVSNCRSNLSAASRWTSTSKTPAIGVPCEGLLFARKRAARSPCPEPPRRRDPLAGW